MAKIIEEYSENGKSVVIMADRHGIYRGEVNLHPDDKDVESTLLGLKLAHLKSAIKVQKNRVFMAKQKSIEAAHIVYTLNEKFGKDERIAESNEARAVIEAVTHQANIAKRDYELELSIYNEIKQTYNDTLGQTDYLKHATDRLRQIREKHNLE